MLYKFEKDQKNFGCVGSCGYVPASVKNLILMILIGIVIENPNIFAFKNHQLRTCDCYFPNSLRSILGLKILAHTVPKWMLIVRRKIPQKLQNLFGRSAQFAQKMGYCWKKASLGVHSPCLKPYIFFLKISFWHQASKMTLKSFGLALKKLWFDEVFNKCVAPMINWYLS